MPLKYITLDDPLYEYVVAHRTTRDDALLEKLRTETEALGEVAEMLISREQGSFLTMLTKLMNVKNAVEVGTFTGYSAICLTRGLSENGRLTCFDLSEEWTSIGQKYWEKSGVAKQIELRLGNAAELVAEFASEPIDLAFIDADKPGYDLYFELLLPKMRLGGLFIFDNMLRGGDVVRNPGGDPGTAALVALNAKLAADPRIESVLLPMADGLHLCRKLGV